MASTSESVLLSKPASKLAGKGQGPVPGIVTISDVKVLWKPETRGACGNEIILLNNIERQQQVKNKPFLRIVSTAVSGGKALGLGFQSEEDRDEVLELLKQRKGPGADVGGAERRAVFAENKDLEALYNQLVPTGILTEIEFWSRHGSSTRRAASSGAASTSKTSKTGQRLGLSSVMHEVQKLHDGKTERVNVTLTPQDIERIFREKPEVNRAFIATVPHEMSENEFWKTYFKLEVKHSARQRNIGGVRSVEEDVEDIFAPFRVQAEREESAAARARLHNVDPTLDLFSEYVGARWAGGSRSMGADAARSDEAIATAGPAAAAAVKLKTLANELNRHSFHVLDGPLGDIFDNDGDKKMTSVDLAASIEVARKKHAADGGVGAGGAGEDAQQEALHRMRASSDLADLRGEKVMRTIPLSINDKMAFLRINKREGESGAVNVLGDVVMTEVRAPIESAASVEFDVDPWALISASCDLPAPDKALEEFCAMDSERFVKEFGTVGLAAASVSPEDAMGGVMVEFFRLEALKTDELLRHFWSTKLASQGADRAGAGENGNHVEKMLRLRKHLAVQRESLDAHIRNAASQGANQIFISRICESLVDQIDAAISV